MAEVMEYKCPCCGGAIEFDVSSQKMKCPYCDTEFDVETLRSYDDALSRAQEDDMTWNRNEENIWQEGETDHMRLYVCQSCGGEIIAEETTAATSCPYCDNPVIMQGQFQGDLRPDYVIPFKLDKNAAKKAMKKHLQNKTLLPKVFKDENHIDEIKGIYVPFWLYNATADAHLSYHGTKVRSWSDSKYIYTETKHYSILRSGDVRFERVPADGSSKMDDTLMESIEPFNFSDAVDFQTAYLAGYLADRYDVTAEECEERANNRIRQGTIDEFQKTVKGYATVVPESTGITLRNAESKYALYPVWILNTTWNDQKFTFAMNGQTGKFVGDLPLDKGALARWFALIGGITGVAVYVILYLVWLFM